MSCDACKDIYVVDEIEPDCFEGACIVPMLDAEGQRIVEIRDRLIVLKDLVDSGTIMKIYGATKEDIEMLAFIETQMDTEKKRR